MIGQLDKALPANILDKYNDRVQEESINLAALDDLVRYISAELNLNLITSQKQTIMKEWHVYAVHRCYSPFYFVVSFW